MTARLVPSPFSRSACWAVPASHPPRWIEPRGSGSTEIVLSGPPRGSNRSRVHTLPAGSTHITRSTDKEARGPTQTLQAYNVTTHTDMCTGSQTNRAKCEFTHLHTHTHTHRIEHNGWLFPLHCESDTDLSPPAFRQRFYWYKLAFDSHSSCMSISWGDFLKCGVVTGHTPQP